MGQPRPLFRLFSVFSNKQYNFFTNQWEKMSCPFSILCQDLNPRPLERESPPIATRPGLPPTLMAFNYLAKYLIYFGTFMLLDICSLLYMANYRRNNLAIWSHWYLVKKVRNYIGHPGKSS